MSDASVPGPGSPLEFDRVAPAEGGDLACDHCGAAIGSRYFTAGDAILCERCRTNLEEQLREQSRVVRFLRASLFGTAAGVVGAGLWWLVTTVTGYEIGLIAIVVGLGVGAAVRAGSHGVGGWPYQIVAIALTYCAIVTSYVPAVSQGLLESLAEERAAEAAAPRGEALAPLVEPAAASTSAVPGLPAALDEEATAGAQGARSVDLVQLDRRQTVALYVLSFGFALAVPFLLGFQNAIGLLIIAFALWEAWKLNAKTELAFAGPFQVGDAV